VSERKKRKTGTSRKRKKRANVEKHVEAVGQANNYAETVMSTMREPLVVLDADLHVVSANRAFYETYHVEQKDVEGKVIFELGDKAWDLPLLRQRFSEVLTEGKIFDGLTVEHDFPVVGRRVLLLNIRPLKLESGGASMLVLTFSDITDFKKAEEGTLFAKDEWERTFDSMPDLVAILDTEHRIKRANKAMAQRLGTTPGQCVGLNCFKGVHKLDAPPSFCPHSLTVSDGKEHVAEVHEDNLGGDFLVSTTPLFDQQGMIIGSVHVARDITERKKAEEEIKSLSRFPAENPNVVMRISKDGNMLYSNNAGLPILNEWKCQVGQPVPSKWHQLVTDVFKSGIKKEFEEKLNGQTFLIMLAPVVDEGYVNVYGRDITERKAAEESLRKAHEELEMRVEERTKELRDASEKLQAENAERKRAEDAVKAERKRFIDVLEKLPAYLVLLTPDYQVSYANRFFRERFGEDRGRRCFEFLFGRTEPCETCETYKTLKSMAPLEWEWTGPDGHNYYIFDSPFTDIDGSTLIMEVGIDITERKKAEEKLREASLYSRSLIEASLDPLVTINAEGKITDVNKATEEATGFSREQLIGSDFSDYFTEPEEARKGYRKVFSEGFVRDYPLAIRHKSGKITDVLYNATVYRNELGEMQGVFAAARDITERKQVEEALRKAHDELEMRVDERTRELTEAAWKLQAEIAERKKAEGQIVEQLHMLELAPVIVMGLNGEVMFWNKGAEGIYGLSEEQTKGKISHELLQTQFPEPLDEIKNKLFSTGEWQGELTRRKADGTTVTVDSHWLLHRDKKNNPSRIIEVNNDITERKQAEKSLLESQVDLNRAQAVAQTGSWRLDVRSNALLWSDETYRMFGIPKGTSLTYETFLNFVHPDDREYVNQQWQAALRGELYDIEHRIVVDGRVRWVREKAELELNKDGVLLSGFGTVQDVTEKREMHAKLEEYSRHLEELVEEKTQKLKEAERLVTIGETAGMVGHDIRNPLQSIEGAVYLAREELKALPDGSSEKKELYQILEIIRHQTNYIDHIVADLQDFSRTPMPQLRETNLHELVIEALSTTEIPEDIQVQTLAQDDLKAVTVDPVFIKRVLLNLIENAAHAMPKGGKLTIKAFCENECTCIHVEDTGVGIREEDKPKMFTPLFTTKAKGQGFGLAVCKKLVEAHRGEITFESEAGKGTTFKVRLPQRKEAV